MGQGKFGFQTVPRVSRRLVELQPLQERSEEEEELHTSQDLPHAAAAPKRERRQLLHLRPVQLALAGQEPLRAEVLRIPPQLFVNEDGVQVDQDYGAFGNVVALKGRVVGRAVRQGEGNGRGKAKRLVSRGFNQRQLGSVGESDFSTLAHDVVDLPEHLLLHIGIGRHQRHAPLEGGGDRAAAGTEDAVQALDHPLSVHPHGSILCRQSVACLDQAVRDVPQVLYVQRRLVFLHFLDSAA